MSEERIKIINPKQAGLYIEDLTPEEYIKYNIENKLKELELFNKDSSIFIRSN